MFGKKRWLIVIVLVLLCMACDLESDSNRGGGDQTPDNPSNPVTNPFLGTWQGTWVAGGNQRLVLSFTETMYNWALVDGGGWGFSGQYTYQGNNATLYGEMPGTAEIRGNDLYFRNDYFGTNETVICRK